MSKRTMSKRTMSKRTMSKSGIPYLDFAFNPCGFGCSKRCDGCWAMKQARGPWVKCPDCRAFKIHFHPERLCLPAGRKKPAVVGVQFTGELCDGKRPMPDIRRVLRAAGLAHQHTYVWLTRNPSLFYLAWRCLSPTPERMPDNWYLGTTITCQEDADRVLPDFLKIPGKLWLSLEPLKSAVDLAKKYGEVGGARRRSVDILKGVVCGHDNRKGAPGTETRKHIPAADMQCANAGIPSFVKQEWMGRTLCKYEPEPHELPWRLTT